MTKSLLRVSVGVSTRGFLLPFGIEHKTYHYDDLDLAVACDDEKILTGEIAVGTIVAEFPRLAGSLDLLGQVA